MKTIDASVKFKATPPAFKEIRKTVTPVFFTKQITVKLQQSASTAEKLTEMLNSGISLLRRHATFKSANLARACINLLILAINQDKLGLTLNPARCNLKAIKSKNDTNCENTSDLIVQSLCLNFSNSSTSASSLEDDRQFYSTVNNGPAMHVRYSSMELTSRLSLLKIPCLAFLVFSSKSKASASRSMEISI